MKMQFHHAGRQFFFITITLERGAAAPGRDGELRPPNPRRDAKATERDAPDPRQDAPDLWRPTLEGPLSQLVDEKSRPALSPRGEAVKATLAAMHGAFPCTTISDFVIMPDHVHFLMIVDYAKNPAFSPLWAAHRLMDATEALWSGYAGEGTGSGAPRTPGGMPPNPRGAATEALAAAVATAKRNQGRLVERCGTAPGKDGGMLPPNPRLATWQDTGLASKQGVRGVRPPVPSPLPARGLALRWDRHCYIELSFDARQLAAIRRYIRLNPARALWKLRHPDRFVRFANFRHPVLDSSRRWDAMGNLTLIASPFLRHVRLTMKLSAEEHGVTIDEIVEQAKRGVVPVCGFISAGEKELLRRLKAEPRARFIKTVPFALPPRYDPSAEDSRELAADRLLILSGFPQGTADSRENLRARCNLMNDLAEALCERAKGAVALGRDGG